MFEKSLAVVTSKKSIEIGFQSAGFHLSQRALVPLLHNDRGQTTGQQKTQESTSYKLCFLH